jgi:hypothetical protein
VPSGLGDANIRLTALRARDARPESASFSVYVLGKPVVDLLGQRMNDYSTTLDRAGTRGTGWFPVSAGLRGFRCFFFLTQ